MLEYVWWLLGSQLGLQTPHLKLWHALGSGTHQLTSSPFFRSIPKNNPMVLSNVAGIHATSIGEHGESFALPYCDLVTDFTRLVIMTTVIPSTWHALCSVGLIVASNPAHALSQDAKGHGCE